MDSDSHPPAHYSRRDVLRAGVAGGAAFAYHASGASAATKTHRRTSSRPKPVGASTLTFDFNQGWRFGGSYSRGDQETAAHDGGYAHVTVPHTVVGLSWGNWTPSAWEDTWIYRKHFPGARLTGGRVFVDFDGVMTNAIVYLNGTEMGQHQGGFLPFSVELTSAIVPGENVLAVVVDSSFLDVPPQGNPSGPVSVDYLMPGGIYRDVTLRVVPEVFVSDVFAKPSAVSSGNPNLDVEATIDASVHVRRRVTVKAEVLDGSRVIAQGTTSAGPTVGTSLATVHLSGLSVSLWSPSSPKLYNVRVTISAHGMPSHTVEVRTGFREALFQTDGFYLNGQQVELFGLNRHQLYPYTGMAASARMEARDAQLLRFGLNCNMVRCSHYPQSPHFLDACDEYGLMVWEEPPGWQYIGDPNFDALLLQNVHDMVIRDRNRPSVIVWATRLDETGGYPTLYAEARSLAYSLDGTRQTTGALTTQTPAGWAEDVFAYDDYTTSNGMMAIRPAVPGVPYMVSESVGAISGSPTYRWIDPSQVLQLQGELHAQAHSEAQQQPDIAGLLAWSGFDYASVQGGVRNWNNLKTTGVLDTFRVAKPGAGVYRSQVGPATPIIAPAFFWDFGPNSPVTGPGPNSMIATNCDQLQIFLNGQPFTVATPQQSGYGGLPYPPAFANLSVVNGSTFPELRIDGYVGSKLVASLTMSADTSTDKLVVALEDTSIVGDGVDTTRLTFRALDPYGNQRPYVSDNVTLRISGPAEIVGQNPFQFEAYGGVGGVFIRGKVGKAGHVTVTASHPTLGSDSVKLTVVRPTGRYL